MHDTIERDGADILRERAETVQIFGESCFEQMKRILENYEGPHVVIALKLCNELLQSDYHGGE